MFKRFRATEELKNWKSTAERVAKAAKQVLGNAHVVAFGSVVRGVFTASSDLDILVVTESLPVGAMKRAQLKKVIEEKAQLPPVHPVEIHLATEEEAEANPIYREALLTGVRM